MRVGGRTSDERIVVSGGWAEGACGTLLLPSYYYLVTTTLDSPCSTSKGEV